MSNDELSVNSLDRFSKKSSRLVLEEHGHCEIPAGCGGVVLRWRNPGDGIPVVFYGYLPRESSIYLDGQPIVTGRTTIPVGDHLLAIHLGKPHFESPNVFIFSAEKDTPDRSSSRSEDKLVRSLFSAADGTWVATAMSPSSDSWTLSEYDDSAWHRLRDTPVDPDQLSDKAQWRFKSAMRSGAMPLLLPDGLETCIRKRFRMEEME